MPLYRISQTLIVSNQRVGGSAVKDIRHDIDGEAIELVQRVVRLSVGEYTDQVLCVPFCDGIIGLADLAGLAVY